MREVDRRLNEHECGLNTLNNAVGCGPEGKGLQMTVALLLHREANQRWWIKTIGTALIGLTVLFVWNRLAESPPAASSNPSGASP